MDDQLIKDCIKGNRLAQKHFYQHFYGKMMGACLRYASCRDEASAILNQGFLKVFRSLEKFNGNMGQLEAWVYRIVVNTAIDHYRRELKHKYHDDVDDHLYHISSEEDALDQLSAEEIIAMVQELPPAYRTVFNLYVIEGYNHREIGEKLGINEGTSKSNLAKARARLQKWIGERDQEIYKRYVR